MSNENVRAPKVGIGIRYREIQFTEIDQISILDIPRREIYRTLIYKKTKTNDRYTVFPIPWPNVLS